MISVIPSTHTRGTHMNKTRSHLAALGLGVLSLLAIPGMATAGPRDHDNNPPGPAGGPGTNWENPPGAAGGPGTSPNRHRFLWGGRNYDFEVRTGGYYFHPEYGYWHPNYGFWNQRSRCWWKPDNDRNPPGPAGGRGTNWENPPGMAGGPGTSPDKFGRCR
jgi:hypothetical protein